MVLCSGTKRCAARSWRFCEEGEMSSSTCSRAMGGWLAGCAAATGVVCVFAPVISAIASSDVNSLRFAGGAIALLFPAVLIFIVTCLLTGIPAALVIWLSEKYRIRSILFFGCVGAVIGGLSQNLLLRALKPSSPGINLLFVVAGLAAGLVYWRLAGKHAGRNRSGDRS